MKNFSKIMLLAGVLLAAAVALLFEVKTLPPQPGPRDFLLLLGIGVVNVTAGVYLTMLLRKPAAEHHATRKTDVSPTTAIVIRIGGLVGVAVFVFLVDWLSVIGGFVTTSTARRTVDLVAIIVAIAGNLYLRYRFRPVSEQ